MKLKLKNIVANTNLDYNSKSTLNYKINQYKIRTENELYEEIIENLEISYKEEKRKREEERKNELKRYVDKTDLTTNSKDKLYHKINIAIITHENELKKEIEKEKVRKNKEGRKKELKRKVEEKKPLEKQELSSYLDTQHMSPITRSKIKYKIRNKTITTIKEIKDEIKKEKILKQNLISYLERTNKGPNTKIKIREKILNGQNKKISNRFV